MSGCLTSLEKSHSKNSESINPLNKFASNESSNHDTNAKETVCRGSRSGTTANKINPYYLIGSIFLYIFIFLY